MTYSDSVKTEVRSIGIMTFFSKKRNWLLPTVLILFILEVITFPFVLGFTWAGRSETPERVLTYTSGKLTWDSAADIDTNGAAEFSLFNSVYGNTKSDNGDKVVAPGTEDGSIVRLKNSVSDTISYTAVLYQIRSTDKLPVEATLTGDRFTDTDSYTLPQGVTDSDVIRAVSGTVGGGLIQDFDINWNWQFENGDKQDVIDTWLGNKAADGDADDVTVGLYIVVEEDNAYVIPGSPQTGDVGIGIYAVLMCISGALLILLLWDKRREFKCEE